jgi:hypothetical protein
MFNGRYGLTQAVIDGRKTMTRRIEFDKEFQKMIDDSDSYYYDDGYLVFATQDVDIHHVKTKYKVGEIVAVAQNYSSFYNILDNTRQIPEGAGWNNKMFVRADLMPHQIRITGIKCERLQDISDADCLKEGVYSDYGDTEFPPREFYDYGGNTDNGFDTPRKAFASLIDKVSGKGTWASNPWVVAYEFELVK